MEQECTQQELFVSSDPVLEVELQSPMDEHWGCDVSRPEFVLGTSDFVLLADDVASDSPWRAPCNIAATCLILSKILYVPLESQSSA